MGIFDFFKRKPAAAPSLGLKPTSQMVADAQRACQEMLALIEGELVASGAFKPEKIPELMAKLRKGVVPFTRIDSSRALAGDTLLTLEEKRTLGLNTRAKYTREFIDCCNPETFAEADPRDVIGTITLRAYHRIHQAESLRELKGTGIVRAVKITISGSPLDACENAIKESARTFSLDNAPELPLPGCDAEVCMCDYTPILKG